MSDTDEPMLARVVVTGVNAEGRSVVESDGPARPWVKRPTGTLVMDLWRADALPISADADSTATDEVVLQPPPHGLAIRTTVFPPDSSISEEASAAYAAAMKDIYGEQGNAGGGSDDIPGMHSTETIDVATVIDGEIWAVMEEGETLLRAGDTMVQRGTRHAWRNRSDRPTTVVTTMLPASRPS
ncbi:cupin domain-containing protein [Streptomyces sp. NBC_01795]|uniref:cupin domain-containing protein n=1 Tax=unclassified Streptomyces TaxID=2593676 RepID=UPI002DDAA159|nr:MULTISPECIES: cupin domain-containing protein [unclassified Streptomyces]WSA90618.1 cupin domain-containing protein [Streptomyces sp. NBC_01795]WSB74945.1 cupin domain-containing protein [Streptomyces sp. NBC_01775]WSS16774.1 cupin domain-containing protein [Streptomyces sp. NBC_01186]